MSVDRSLRSMFAAVLLIAALFVAMNRVVASAPLADWWLPLALAIIGAALVPNWNFARSQPDADEEAVAPALAAPDVHLYRVAAQQVPRLQTMTIRPDPESAEYTVVTISEDTAKGEILPFIETEVVPGTTTTAAPATPAPAATSTPAPVAPAPSAESVTPAAPAQPPAPVAAAPAPVAAPSAEPAPATAPAPTASGTPDDLTRLNGIGPKSAAALTAAGIDTFQKIASASDEQLRAAVAGVRLVGDVTSWASQAAYAARGDWEGLAQLKATLRSKPSSGD